MAEKRVRKAVFPVAGLGTRFLPVTKAQPKEMLPVVDKPLIQYAVEEAVAAGITEMVFVTGRSKRAIEDHFDVNYELEAELEAKGLEEAQIATLAPQRTFPGDRPSTSLLGAGALDARAAGALLALYEHRTVVEGFVWGISSFDQWGVELGKKLATNVRGALQAGREAAGGGSAAAAAAASAAGTFNPSTRVLLARYLQSPAAAV
jgi:hypothetical protein